jgi:hypothetical protein
MSEVLKRRKPLQARAFGVKNSKQWLSIWRVVRLDDPGAEKNGHGEKPVTGSDDAFKDRCLELFEQARRRLGNKGPLVPFVIGEYIGIACPKRYSASLEHSSYLLEWFIDSLSESPLPKKTGKGNGKFQAVDQDRYISPRAP